MTARAHSRTPSATVSTGTRLPWWGLVLPVLAFAVLLALLATSGQAQGESSAVLAVSELFERFQRLAGS